MATLKPVIVPAKALSGGRHKIRIAVAHNGTTRYIVTDITIDSDKEFKNGQVVKRPDASMLNTKIRTILQKLQKGIDQLDYTDGLTCPELIALLKNADKYSHRTLASIYEEYVANSKARPHTVRVFRSSWYNIEKYIGGTTLMERINHATIMAFDKALSRNLSQSTVRTYMAFLSTLVNYAIKCGYSQYRINPFLGYTMPPITTRNSWLSVDEVRKVRDFVTTKKNLARVRDYFMLSYYLGGINMIDLLKVNFNQQKNVLKYERTKTSDMPKFNKYVEFEIPDEAKEIIARRIDASGYIKALEYERNEAICTYLYRNMRKLATMLGIPQLIYYSARKSFSQHAFVLGVPTPVIDFILGHKVGKNGQCLYSYVAVTPDMATKAVRKVLDNLK